MFINLRHLMNSFNFPNFNLKSDILGMLLKSDITIFWILPAITNIP